MRKEPIRITHPLIAKQLKNQDLADKITAGSDRKVEWIGECGHEWSASVYNRVASKNPTNCPICNGKKILIGFNDLATTHPDIAKMCLDNPLTVTGMSNKKCKWRCEKGHEWVAPVVRLTGQGSGCPYCSGRKAIIGVNDLATLYPELVKELVNPEDRFLKPGSNKKVEWQCLKNPEHRWFEKPYHRTKVGTGCPFCSHHRVMLNETDLLTTDPELAKTLKYPEQAKTVSRGSEKKLEWTCDKHPGVTWMATPYNRIKSGCPYCANRKVIVGFNDLATTHPELAKELVDFELSKKLTYGSGQRVEWMCKKGHVWTAPVYRRTGKEKSGCPVCNPIPFSEAEKELAEIVKQLVGPVEVLLNDRTFLPSQKELDIVVPSKKIAIEFNGVYWHNSERKSTDYHYEKLQECKGIGYQLIQIWEDDWIEKKDLIIMMLSYKLHCFSNLSLVLPNIESELLDTCFARNLTPKIISYHESSVFLDSYHIQGKVNCTFHFGLFDCKDNLRAVLSIRSSKHNARVHRQAGEWDIQRYATCGHIPGGFTKLLKFAEKKLKEQNVELKRWISFSSNDVSDGRLYKQCGFTMVNELKPDYKYVGNFTGWKRMPKERFQKKFFRTNTNLLWDESWTEMQAAEKNSLYRIYDSGKMKWVKDVW